jgi:hypothetical protein
MMFIFFLRRKRSSRNSAANRTIKGKYRLNFVTYELAVSTDRYNRMTMLLLDIFWGRYLYTTITKKRIE